MKILIIYIINNQWLLHQKIINNLNNIYYAHELLPLASCIFLMGLVGFLESREFFSSLVNIELIILGLNFYLITASFIWGDYFGQLYALCFLAVTAAETAVGLGLLILLYRGTGKINFADNSTLKG